MYGTAILNTQIGGWAWQIPDTVDTIELASSY